MNGELFEALAGISLMEPSHGLRTNVFARAKRALKAGELLDGLGGHAAQQGRAQHRALGLAAALNAPIEDTMFQSANCVE